MEAGYVVNYNVCFLVPVKIDKKEMKSPKMEMNYANAVGDRFRGFIRTSREFQKSKV